MVFIWCFSAALSSLNLENALEQRKLLTWEQFGVWIFFGVLSNCCPDVCFCKQQRSVSSGHVPARSSHPVSKEVSSSYSLHRPCVCKTTVRAQAPFHPCACMTTTVNICHAYLYMYSQEIYVLWFHSTALFSVHRPQKQELLRRPCKATASSLRNH